MDKEGSRKYESIDALIMAAEVLERAEAMAKEQVTLPNNSQIMDDCMNNINDFDVRYFYELRTSERWNKLMDINNKSENQILYRELSHLKRKLNKIKGIRINSNNILPMIKQEEDEDTSTASEDEGYNKYHPINVHDNLDDITDDASECEQAIERSHKSKLYTCISSSRNAKNRNYKLRNLIPVPEVSDIRSNTSRTGNKRKLSYHVSHSPLASKISPKTSMALIQHMPESKNCVAVPLFDVHSPPDYKTLLKVHQAVDI